MKLVSSVSFKIKHGMKYFLCYLFFMISGFTVFCQNFNYGVGIASNFSWLQHEVPKQLDDFSFNNRLGTRPSVNAFAEWSSQSAFRFRVSAYYNPKQMNVKLIQTFDEERSTEERYNYNFSAADLGLSASYNLLPTSSRWKLIPKVGFLLGFADYQTFFSSISSNFSGGISSVNRDIEGSIQDKEAFIYTAIQTGIDFQPPLFLFQRQLEFSTTFQYSPRSFLKNPIVLDPFSIEGNYHSVSIGVNCLLKKSKADE